MEQGELLWTFQLTTSRGGRPSLLIRDSRLAVFQLTTSRGGRPLTYLLEITFPTISTHDLTRRSTAWNRRRFKSLYHFNSRPHEEVDMDCISEKVAYLIFQLTTSRGGRHYYAVQQVLDGAFQLTTSRGGRLAVPTIPPNTVLFQLTTSRGGRLRYSIA